MPRVYEVAREMNLTSEEVLRNLAEIGEPVSSHSSSVDDGVVTRLKEHVAASGPSDDASTLPINPETAAPEGSLAVEAPPATDPEMTDSGATEAAPAGGATATRKVLPKKRWRGILKGVAELPILVIFAFLIAVLIKSFLVQAFYIPSGSMVPTLRVGDRVLVEKISYFVGDPGRGQVVVFARSVFGKKRPDVPWYRDVQNYLRELLGLPTGQEEDYIKRVVAVGNDTIRYEGKPRRLYVNGERVEEPYINNGRDGSSTTLTRKDCKDLKMEPTREGCRVPADKVFVMGDNRGNSEDSRVIGPVAEDKIVGRAFIIIWPAKDFGTI